MQEIDAFVNGGRFESPPNSWVKASFQDNQWATAVEMFQLGSGPWGGGHNSNFPADAQWMWTSESVAHNDIFCRIVIPVRAARASAAGHLIL